MKKRLLQFLVAGTAIYFLLRRVTNTCRRLTAKRRPNFFYKDVGADQLGIPVFTYHSVGSRATPDSVTPAEFERHMAYLAQTGYHTLHADELYHHLVSGRPLPPKSVLLTFDDGRATLWTIAYPILQKYHLKAVSFLVPATMQATGVRPNLNDYNAGQSVSMDALTNADLSDTPAITWDEARQMHAGGLIDFQSHTFQHTLIFYTPEITDFINPTFRFGYHNYAVPVIRYGDADRLYTRPRIGTPIYRYQSRMGAARRFFDDETLREACVDYVEQNGSEIFFNNPRWRTQLTQFAAEYRRQHSLRELFETEAEQAQAIRHSLNCSKQLIEGNLPQHTVRHISYPWHRYSALANCLAGETGYVSAFIDINPQKPFPVWNDPYPVQKILPVNEYGDDPYQISRIDARDNAVLSLPGRERLTYRQRLVAGLLKPPALFGGCP